VGIDLFIQSRNLSTHAYTLKPLTLTPECRYFGLASNNIGDVGATALITCQLPPHTCQLMPTTCQLKHDRQNAQPPKPEPETPQITTLIWQHRYLGLASNNIGDVGATALGEALRFCVSLNTLDLSSNQVVNPTFFSVRLRV